MKNLVTWMSPLVFTAIIFTNSPAFSETTARSKKQEVNSPKHQARPTYGIKTSLYEKLNQIDNLLNDQNVLNADALALDKSELLFTQCNNCNPYELATLHRYIAWLAFETGNQQKALDHFKSITDLSPEIPLDFELAALLALAKIYYQEENFNEAWTHLSKWQQLSTNIPADIHELTARIQYFRGQHSSALAHMQTAIVLEEAEGRIAAEAWYLFTRSLFYEKEDFTACLQVQRKLVTYYNSQAHWRDLAVFYGLLGDNENQLSAYDAAWVLDGLKKEADILNFSLLLQNAGYPYKAATILEYALGDGRIASTNKSLELTARAWYLAEERGRAIASLEKASELGANGNLLVFLAELYMEADLFQQALIYFDNALEQGDLTYPGRVHLNKGIALMELTQFAAARSAFQKAQQVKATTEMATRWLAHLQHEETRHQQLQLSQR